MPEPPVGLNTVTARNEAHGINTRIPRYRFWNIARDATIRWQWRCHHCTQHVSECIRRQASRLLRVSHHQVRLEAPTQLAHQRGRITLEPGYPGSSTSHALYTCVACADAVPLCRGLASVPEPPVGLHTVTARSEAHGRNPRILHYRFWNIARGTQLFLFVSRIWKKKETSCL